jgi:hypothetical protein
MVGRLLGERRIVGPVPGIKRRIVMKRSRITVLATSLVAACGVAPTAAAAPRSAPLQPAHANCERLGGTFFSDLEPNSYNCLFLGVGSVSPNDVISARVLCENVYGGIFGQSPATGNYACDLPQA